MRVAVVGHLEWVEFARVERVPAPGEIVRALESFEEPAGGGPVAAAQLAKLAGSARFYTALGDDELGHRSVRRLAELGVEVHAAFRDAPTRRAFTFLDGTGERTITVIGRRLAPRGSDPLPWDDFEEVDAVYLSAGDRGAIAGARRAHVLVATARVLPDLAAARVHLDALVGSARDPDERYERGSIDPVPRLVVRTAGSAGGTYETAEGVEGIFPATPLPGPVADAYGCGDSFAAGLTFGLGAGCPREDALTLAAECGAACLTGRGPFEGQLRLGAGSRPAPEPAGEPPSGR